MFGLFKSKNPYAQPAEHVYGAVLDQTRRSVFYTDYGVPDSFDGRFDLLLVHIYLVLQVMLDETRAEAEDFNQALFDETFKDMDQTLREMGIGDMGIPKHMRKMMRAFNGRMHAYQAGLDESDLEDALRKNLYGTLEDVDSAHIKAFEKYMMNTLKFLKAQGADAILAGTIEFKKEAQSDAA